MDYVTSESSLVAGKIQATEVVSFFSSNQVARAAWDTIGDSMDGISPSHNR
jgi:hypothetical protein